MSTVRYQRYLHNTALDRQPIILPIRYHIRSSARAEPDNHQSSLCLPCVGDTHNSSRDPLQLRPLAPVARTAFIAAIITPAAAGSSM
jgi:hypothetical protein